MGGLGLLFIILLFVSIISVVFALIKIVESKACPDRATIERVVLYPKDQNDGETSRVLRHLGICDECQEIIDEINGKQIEFK